jgi:hypothetical protein
MYGEPRELGCRGRTAAATTAAAAAAAAVDAAAAAAGVWRRTRAAFAQRFGRGRGW